MIKRFFTVLIFISLVGFSFSNTTNNSPETITVKGKVLIINSKTPIEDAFIRVKGKGTNVFSDSKGNYSIKAKKGEYLIITNLGYKSKQILITGEKMDIYLEPTGTLELEEVVVVSRKNINDIDMRKLAGAIETIDASTFANRPEMDLLKMLQGQVPGLSVTTTGELGAKPKIRIRGESSFVKDITDVSPLAKKTESVSGRISDEFMERRRASANEPLYILDGIVISSDAFLALNPEDFNEIKVLKDAAASALYGIKAANGVIEISSKRGRAGKRSISLSIKQGLTLKSKQGAKMMNSAEKLELERRLKNPKAPGYLYSEDYLKEKYATDPHLDQILASGAQKTDSLRSINTNWYDELLRVSRYESYSLGIRGGNEDNLYYYSTNYSKQGGQLVGNSVHRFTGRANLDYKINPKLTVSLNGSFGLSQTLTPNGGGDDDIYSLIYKLNPYEQNKKGTDGSSPYLYSFTDRTINDFFNQYNSTSSSKRFSGSSVFHWKVAKGLDLSGVVGADFLIEESKRVTAKTAYAEKIYPETSRGTLSEFKATELNVSANIRANYVKTIDDHNIMLGLNYDYYREQIDNIGFRAHGLPSVVKTVAGVNQSLVGTRAPRLSGTKEATAQYGIGASGGYTYKGIYDAYGSFKYDASSLLPKEKRGNVAWAVGGGWSIGNYKIFKELEFLSSFKLRASYGYTASMAGISPASTVPIFSYSSSFYSQARILEMRTMYNKDLKPQATRSINFGGDIELFKRLNIGFDMYRNTTEDALLDVPIQPSIGFLSMVKNVGVLQNDGVEFKIRGDILSSADFSWTVLASLSYNRNKVVDLYDKSRLFTSYDSKLPDLEVGKPMNALYGLQSLGLNPIDGLPRYLSPSGQTLNYTDMVNLKESDFIALGYTTPPYNGFINSNLRYKKLTLGLNFYFIRGGIARERRDLVRDRSKAYYNAIADQTANMWFNIGDENKIYMNPNPNSHVYDMLQYPNSDDIYKTDYISLTNVHLSYNVPHSLLSTISKNISYAHLFLEAENVFTIYKQKPRGSITNYPQPVLMMGVSLTF